MKKYFLYLVLFISSLFISFSVKAESISTNFGNVIFDFDTFISDNNLTDYNYYTIVLRNNGQMPVLTLFKNKPVLSNYPKWSITLKDPSEEPVLLYTYNFSTNVWSSSTNNEAGQFSSRNIIYSSNFNSVYYNGEYINLVKNNNYYSFIRDYYSDFSFVHSYNNYSATITYNNENNSIVFDNIDDNLDGSITITKNYWYLVFSVNNYEIYLYQSDTPLYLLHNGTNYNSLCLSNNNSTCHTNQDTFLYNLNLGPSNSSFTFTNTFYNIFSDTLTNVTSFEYINANNSFIHNGDVLDSNDNIISSSNFVNDVLRTTNLVVDFGNNSYGFYQNYLSLNSVTLSGSVDSLSTNCELDKPFDNGFCTLSYNDFYNYNNNISHFNNFGFSFIQYFGQNSGYLGNNYYLYSFRLMKPFTPKVGNLFINYDSGNTYQTELLDVYYYDAGSYTDYVVKFRISNTSLDSSSDLSSIYVVFSEPLSYYYYDNMPNTFIYGLYRSFKLQIFNSEPTSSDVQNFISYNDLSSINSNHSQSSFFTDNEFNTFGFGGIVSAPFRFLSAIQNYQTCSDITIPFPHSNRTLTLKCVRSSIPSSLNPLISVLQIILSGFICYRIAVETLSVIKDITSPKDANIEVVDL